MTIEHDKSASFWSTTDFARSLSEQLAIVFGALHEGVVVHDSTGQIIASNPAAQRILGLTSDQLAGVSALDPRWRSIREDGKDFPAEAHPSTIARNTGKPVRNIVMGVQRTDGSQVWVNVNAEPLRDPNGKIAGVVVGFTDITAWRETQQQLRSSSLQLVSVFESLREGVIVRSLEGIITAYNPAAERMLGLYKDSTTGHVRIDPECQQVHPDGSVAAFEELPSVRVLRTGEPLRGLLMGIRKSGDVIAWHNVNSEPVRDAFGDIIGVVTSFTDCTEHLRNENELQRSNELLQAAQETAHVGGWEWDVANDTIYWSEETYRLFETTRAEYTPTVNDVGRFFDTADAPAIRQKIREAIMSGQSLETEVELLTARGRRIWVRTMCTPTQVNGRTVKLSGAFQDVTDRKHAEQVQTALYKISNASRASGTLDELYRRIHAIIGELMPAENIFIALLDIERDEVTFPYWVDSEDPRPEPRRFSDGGGLTNWVLKHGKPLLLTPQSSKDGALPDGSRLIGTDSIDWLGVPLMVLDRAIGVIAVQSYTGEIRYNERHLELLQFVSNEIATAVNRKRSDDLLRDNEEKYRSLFDKSPVYITLIELPEGTFVEVNDACLAGFGYTREDVIGKTTLDFGAWEDPKQRDLFFKTLQDKGKVSNFEAVMLRKDRTPVTVLFTATRLRIGSRDYVLNLLLDVSERRLIETRLRDNEAKFRLVFDQSPSMIALLGCPDGEFVEVNDIGVETFGHVREAMIGRTSVELDVWVNPEDRVRYLEMLREQGTVRDFETVLRRKNGEHFVVLFNGSIVTLDGRQYSLNSIKDITERKQAEAQLRESDQRFRDLVDSTDGIVWQADASTFVFDYVSNNAERLLGYPNTEWLRPGFWADHIVPDDRDWAVEFCATCTNRLENHEFEYRFITKDGRIVWLRDIVKVVSDNGKPRWLRGLMLDITTMKQTQQSLEQANLSLEQTQHLLEASQYAAQVGGWELDLGLNTLFWTDETYRIHDLHPREYSPSVDTAIAFYTAESRLTLTAALQLATEEGTPYDLELELISAHGRHVWVRTTGSATRVQNRTIKIGGAIQDITERKRAEQWQQHYSHVLAMISAESPVAVALDALARFVEQQSEAAYCSTLLLTPDGSRLVLGAAPSLPGYFIEEINGIELGEAGGACGVAALTGAPVLIEDFAVQEGMLPRWRELAVRSGMRSVWSVPIFSAEHKVMGTFAIYHAEPWGPTSDDEELIRRSASLAALAIDRARHQEAQRLAKTVFEENVEGVMVTAPDDRILMVNKAFERLTGFSAKDAVGQTPATLLDSGRHDQSFWSEIQTQLALTGRWEGEIWSRRKNGEIYPVQMSIADVRDNADTVSQRISIMTDVSLQKVQAARIEQLAFYDVLTGLPNRALFLDRLEHILTSAQRHGGRGAILFLDLDRFKEINDSKGHAIGDLALAEAARRFLAATRREETLARLGGDEFVLIAEGADHRSASLIASRLLQSLSEPLLLMGSAHSIGTSIGIAFYPDDGTTSEELIKHTDIAMYRAKSAGGGYRFYQAEMGAELEKRLGIAQKLGPAIEANQLQLYYQPKIELATGRLVGAEALLRWKDPEWGWISPGEFIPIAEQRGMMNKLGDWVLREGCLQLRRWRDLGIGMNGRLAINVSAQQMEDPEIVGRMLEIVHEAGATPEWIELELTESSMMSDPEHTIEIMEFLAAAGFGLSIDDFGTGYSSLSYLKRFSADEIKIDISFVRNMLNDKNDYAIVNTIIAMAHSLGLSTTAEGVELEGQAEALKAMGCETGQGYLFGRPEAPETFSGKWLPTSSG